MLRVIKKIECMLFPCTVKLENALKMPEVREEISARFSQNRQHVMKALNGKA